MKRPRWGRIKLPKAKSAFISSYALKKHLLKTPHPDNTHYRFRRGPSDVSAVSLHHDLPRHLRVDRTKVRIRTCLSKCVREHLVRIPHLGLEHTFCADHGVGNIITVGPDDRRSDRYRQRLRPKAEIVNFHVCACL